MTIEPKTPEPTTRNRNAVLKAEIDAWLAGPEVETPEEAKTSPFVNIRAIGFSRQSDALKWARRYDVAFVKMPGGVLMSRRADAAPAMAAHNAMIPDAPARETDATKMLWLLGWIPDAPSEGKG